ncbi:MAG: hypothetical protein PHE15_06605 [Dehalococcoidales bacterium]|nr:hypothetical protein [Dehalococcoidales bacterium]
MSSLTTIEKRCLESILGMNSGYVLDFTNESFSQLFYDNVKIDIYNDKYSTYGTSKAKRLRAFWETEYDAIVGKLLSILLVVWKYNNTDNNPLFINRYNECRIIVKRLLGNQPKEIDTQNDFLIYDFGDFSLNNLDLDPKLISIIESRIKEAKICLKNNLSMSVIFLCGSSLEGILLAMANKHPKEFNQCNCSPKDKNGKVKPFQEWNLANLIDASCEIGLLGLDVKYFCHVLRDFRNYIHPLQQLSCGFSPDEKTAQICMKVVEAAIADIKNKKW